MTEFSKLIFSVTDEGFGKLATEIFRFQYLHNQLYRYFVDELRTDIDKISSLEQIPFLPIGFFKTHDIKTGTFDAEIVFESSGTTKTANSRHHVKDEALYRKSFIKGFERFYGPIKNWCIIGLLPSYLERKNSSLIMMVNELIKITAHPQSGFYLYEYEQLNDILQKLENKKQQVLLIGVTFALLDFAEKYPQQLKSTVVMETGGMKGRRKEITREEAHHYLRNRLGVNVIHSEYGMTELLSQAYSKDQGLFECVPWMKVLLRNEDDPFDVTEVGRGIINIIDFANVYSCSFIATDDVGTVHKDGKFEVAGRLDNSDMRGCSLLVI